MKVKKVLLIGDSITEDFPISENLNGFNIINKGIYGDNTQGVLSRLQKDVINEYPDYVFLLIGTNDLALEKSDEQILETVHNIIDTLTSSLVLAEIYLTSILPTKDIENRPNDRINSINKNFQKMVNNFGVHYFDLASFFKNEMGELKSELTDDGLHLSVKGYQLWAEVLKNKLSIKPTLC